MDGGAVRRITRGTTIFGVGLLLSLLGFATIASPAPAQAATLNPYGFSVWGYQNRITASGVKWVRLQRDWSSIESSPGVYNFSGLDQDIAAANAAGVHATVPIQDAPGFRKTQVCNGVNLFPGPNEMSTFAAILATRYNGHNGHGYVDSFEIGNEEWDGYWGGSWANTLPCRSASYYGPVLRAGYQAVKAHSGALVGMFGMWWVNTPHIQSYMSWLYQNGYGANMDFANFHYYTGGNPAVTNGDTPSFDLEWQTIRSVQAAHGDGGKPVWCTETGWAISSVGQGGNPIVSPAQQSQYEQYVLNSARTSNVMQRVFIYMISDTGYDGMNIYPPSGPLPSYTMLEGFMAQYPSWGASAPAPTPTPTPAPTPNPTPAPTSGATPNPTATPAPTYGATPAPTNSSATGSGSNSSTTHNSSTPSTSQKAGTPGNQTALRSTGSGPGASTRNFPAEISSSPATGFAHLVSALTSALGSAGMMVVLWFALGAFVWVALRVLTLHSAARRRRAMYY